MITAVIRKKYKSISKKYKSIIKKKNDEIVLLAKTKLNTIEVFISKILINSDVIHDELTAVNNVLRESNDMKEAIKNPNDRFDATKKMLISGKSLLIKTKLIFIVLNS